MKPSAPPLGLSAVGNPIVRSAIEAVNGRDEKRWFGLFSDAPGFTDDGIRQDFAEWCKEELFGSWSAYLVSIDRVEDGGLTFYAEYHSDKWGNFKTFWRFVVKDGRITRLDVGATQY